MLSKKSSVSRSKVARRLSSTSLNLSGSGFQSATLRRRNHCPAKFCHQGFGFGVGCGHAPDLRGKHGGLMQLRFFGETEEFLVGDAAPEEERQARGEVQVGQMIRRALRRDGRGPLDAEEEFGRDEDAAQAHLDAGIERAAIGLAGGEEFHQGVGVGGGDWSSIGAAGERGEDLPRANIFRLGWLGVADENAATALGFTGTRGIIGAADADVFDRNAIG